MELNLGTVSYDGKWFDFGGGRLKVRPHPGSKVNFAIKNGVSVVLGEQTFDKFAYCLEAWEGFTAPARDGKPGEPIVLDDTVKRKIFDFRIGKAVVDGAEVVLVDFVITKADELFAEIRGAEKN